MKTLPRLDETLDTLRRRIGLVLVVMSLGFMISAALGMAQRPTWESREAIEAAAPRLSGTGSDALRGQVESLVRAITAGESLLSIAAAYDLFPSGLSAEDQLVALRQAVDVTVTPEQPPQPLRIDIAARWDDPEKAQLLAQELGHRIVRESVLLRIASAQATAEYHAAREASLRADLADLETRLADFRATHDADLAAADPTGIEALAALDARILALDPSDDRSRAELAADRQALLRALAPPPKLSADYSALLSSLASLDAQLKDAATRRRAAEDSLLAETRRMAERLTVTQPAERPETPLQDHRRAFAFAGGLLSALIAVAAALFLDWRNPVVRTASQLRRLTSADTVVSVPRATPESRRRNGTS